MLGELLRGALAGVLTGAVLGSIVWYFLGSTFFSGDAVILGIGAGVVLGGFLGDEFVDGMRSLITRSRVYRGGRWPFDGDQ